MRSITGKAAVFSDSPVTGNDDGNLIGPDSTADRLSGHAGRASGADLRLKMRECAGTLFNVRLIQHAGIKQDVEGQIECQKIISV